MKLHFIQEFVLLLLLFFFVVASFFFSLLPRLGHAAPLAGQIIVDPDTPRWLKYNGGGPFFMCGPGDPEGFLYRGTRNEDGTRNGDQMTLINKVKGTGANSIYMQIIRSHGGDGSADHNPFINSDPVQGIDQDILDQWETWFTEMDNNGIVIYLFFYGDSSRVWDTGATVGSEERLFIQTIVNRFEHHKNLMWIVAEEYSEAFSALRASNIAAEIRAADDYDHVIAVNQHSGVTFDFADDPNIDQFAIQYNVRTAAELHAGMVTAWNNAAGRYNLNMVEAVSYGTGTTAKKKDWAIAMGGAYVMRLRMDIAGTSVSDLNDCGRLVRFMQSTNFNQMAPHDELKYGGTEYVLAFPGDSYIAYASALTGDIGLQNMTAGTYDFKWFDTINETTVNQTGISVASGNQSWIKPATIGNELALYIKKTGGAVNAPPTANPQNITVPYNTATSITLTYSDPDGPGPYIFDIVNQPTNGVLAGSEANRTYTPNLEATGADSFTFTVNDSLATSNTAMINISIGNTAPVAANQSLTTSQDAPIPFILSYSDSDGPGPYTVTILSQPAHGTLSATGNDCTYTPNTGYTGTDSFTWKVNDGLIDSNIATVSVTIMAGPISYWKFDEGTGSIANDSSGNNNTGSLVNGPLWINGKINSALSFDGINDSVRIDNAITPPNQGTIVLWFDTNSASTKQRILGGHDAFEVMIDGGKLYNQLFAGGNSNTISNTFLTSEQWYHAALTYDAATTKQQIYINGVLDSTGNYADDIPGTITLSIGVRTGTTQYFKGIIDEVIMYNRVLNAAEITELYNSSLAPDTTPPSTPSNFTATPFSSSRINLSWSASTDNIGVAGYKIFRDGFLIASSTTTNYSDTNLAASTTYTYNISAYDAAGNESMLSSIASATTRDLLPSANILFTDMFERPNSALVGNNWIETEATGAALGIQANKLSFLDTSDIANRPMISNSFQNVSSGKIEWNFQFDWTRTGAEGTYRLFMQLGDGAIMTSNNQDNGVGVNLIWTAIGGLHERLGYRKGGVNTDITLLQGINNFSIIADLDIKTYDLILNGTLLRAGIPFDNAVSINTVRIFTDNLNEVNFSGRTFDNVEIILSTGI